MTRRPEFVLTLRPEPRTDPLRALRSLLKVALRSYGLRCTGIVQRRDAILSPQPGRAQLPSPRKTENRT
jgi:hypothetical protein